MSASQHKLVIRGIPGMTMNSGLKQVNLAEYEKSRYILGT